MRSKFLALMAGAVFTLVSAGFALYGARTSVFVPEGTEIEVRNNETIDSQNASPGQTYSAVVDSDVQGRQGEVFIPQGSNAELVIRDINSGSTTGGPQLGA